MLNYWILTSRTLLLFGVAPLLLGCAVAWLGWVWKSESAAFVDNLRQTDARILQFLPGDNDWVIDVEYMDEEGRKYPAKFHVANGEEPELRAVGKISVVYDSRDPRKAETGHIVSANNELLFDTAIVACGVLLLVGGLFTILRRARQVAAIGKLFRQGPLVSTEVRDQALAPGKQEGRFTYAFRGPNGRWYEGKSPDLPASRLEEWPVGRALTVAYNPRDPRKNEPDIYGLLERRQRNAEQTA